jgi:hypothetical protein
MVVAAVPGVAAHDVPRVFSPAGAPTPGPPSLSLSGDLALGATANLFKDGEAFLWDDPAGNTAFGRQALVAASGGATHNTAVGRGVLQNATAPASEGFGNTGVGYLALLANTIGFGNTGAGAGALAASTSGNRNTAVGASALAATTTGELNTAVGENAMRDNLTGVGNTALGSSALLFNTVGNHNTAAGYGALRDQLSGDLNTAVGAVALSSNTSGSGNTALGAYSMRFNTTGSNNTAVGRSALGSNTEGHRNVAIGALAGSNVSGAGRDDNVFIGNPGLSDDARKIRIGMPDVHTATFIAGVSGSTVAGSTLLVSAEGQLGVSTFSAGAMEGVAPLEGLHHRLGSLRPVVFRYREDLVPGGGEQVGLIAEEVAEAFPELAVRNRHGEPVGVRYDLLSVLLLAELQRQQGELDELALGMWELSLRTVPSAMAVQGVATAFAAAELAAPRGAPQGDRAKEISMPPDRAAPALVPREVWQETGRRHEGMRPRPGAVGATLSPAAAAPLPGPEMVAQPAAPSLGAPSLTVGGPLALGAASNIFKDGQVFLWDDEAGNSALGRQALASATGSATGNTAVGWGALQSTIEGAQPWHGSENTAVGREALASNTVGYRNTGVGSDALRHTTSGSHNTAVGSNALLFNTSGSANTALGLSALENNTTGVANTAAGDFALFDNSGGQGGTALGGGALFRNTTGTFNTAAGFNALVFNTTGGSNTAVGYEALRFNQTGTFNTALGNLALEKATQGNNNIAVGRSAGRNVTGDPQRNIHIANVGEATDSLVIRIGTQAPGGELGAQSAAYLAGVSDATVAGGTVLVTPQGQLGVASSSARVKEGVRALPEVAPHLGALQPVAFRYRPEVLAGGHEQVGLLAEQVAALLPELVVLDDGGRPWAVRYDLLSVLLLEELRSQERELARLRAALAELQAMEAEEEPWEASAFLARPVLIAPGGRGRTLATESSCPTFSWAGVEGAAGYELVVAPSPDSTLQRGVVAHPTLRLWLPPDARSWTPDGTRCLDRGVAYAWSIRPLEPGAAGPWAVPGHFRYAGGAPMPEEVVASLDTQRRHTRALPESHLKPSGEPRPGSGQIPAKPRLTPPSKAVEIDISPSVTVSGDVALGAGSNLFKAGDLFLWDDAAGNTAFGRQSLAAANGSAVDNTAVGYRALQNAIGGAWPEGASNTAVGYEALRSNTTGYQNTAIGRHTLRSETWGYGNTAVGELAMLHADGSGSNAAVGWEALRSSTVAWLNVAVGSYSMRDAESPLENVAVGLGTLRFDTGDANTALGFEASLGTAGVRNTAAGAWALAGMSSASSDFHVAVGREALLQATAGTSHVAVGYGAGSALTSETSHNLFIANAGEAVDSATIRIGTLGLQDAAYVAGIAGTTVTGAQALVSSQGQLGVATSSARFKEGITELERVGDRLAALRPVRFHYQEEVAPGADPQVGLLAEQVAALFPALVVPDAEGRPAGVRYDLLSVLLLEELQHRRGELARRAEELAALSSPMAAHALAAPR